MASTGTQTNSSLLRYLEDVRDGVVEMFPLLCVEVLQLRGVLVLALVGRVRPGVELVLGLDIFCPKVQLLCRKPSTKRRFQPGQQDRTPLTLSTSDLVALMSLSKRSKLIWDFSASLHSLSNFFLL